MKRFFLLAALVSTALAMPVSAQENTPAKQGKKPKKEYRVLLYGHVHDSFTKAGIPGTFITLMRPDSTVIDTAHVFRNAQPGVSYDATYRFSLPTIVQDIIIRAEHPDYETTFVNYHVRPARNEWLDAPHHYMKRNRPSPAPAPSRGGRGVDTDSSLNLDSIEAAWEVKLQQVNITATKVKIAYRGDTVVYNADAFNVPEGSMLDGLIKQLPGVELQSDGQIFVNGRKIDNLTLNGKDFFRGRNRVMLDNLPYYTVKEIKVFDAQTDKSRLLGRDVEEREYTMDVALKREYNHGTMANAEVGGGLSEEEGEEPYLARLFGLYFSDNLRATLFGNLNNINQWAHASADGNWSTAGSNFRQRYKNLGGEITFNDRGNNLTNSLEYNVNYRHEDAQQRNHMENYLSTGNTFGRSTYHGLGKEFSYDIQNHFRLKFPFVMRSNLIFTGGNQRNSSRNTSQTFSDAAEQQLVNDMMSESLLRQHNDYIGLDNTATFKLPSGDSFNLTLDGIYTRTRADNFSHDAYNYTLTPAQNSRRNQYNHTPSRRYILNAETSYDIHWRNHWDFTAGYSYEQEYNEQTSALHRLDLLNTLWADVSTHALGDLPQTHDSIMAALDLANSYDQTTLRRRHRGYFVFQYFESIQDKHYLQFVFSMPFSHEQRTLHYHSSPLATDLTRHYNWLAPTLFLQYYDRNYSRGGHIRMQLTQTQPELIQLVDRRNDANPLAVQTGNPDLKPTQRFNVEIHGQIGQRERDRSLSLWSHVNLFRNVIGTGYTYDPTSGQRTYHPMNINGNWDTGIELYYNTALDSAKCWHINTTTDYDFSHTRDLAAIAGATDDGFSTVNNHRLRNGLRIRYNRGKLSLNFGGEAIWRRILRDTSTATGLAGQSVWDYNYGLTATYTLPLDIQFSTTLSMQSRRGYQDKAMNDDEFVANAQLSRTFLHGRLTATLIGEDLFGQRTNTTYEVNAQGRTERWTNMLGRYVLLSLAYKFNTTPKKK